MAGLKYDTGTMRETASKYREIARTMTKLQNTLKKQIADLKSVYWKSDAGDAFQKMYEGNWADNVNKYVAVLDEMANQLDTAANEYDKITVELKQIEGVSVR